LFIIIFSLLQLAVVYSAVVMLPSLCARHIYHMETLNS